MVDSKENYKFDPGVQLVLYFFYVHFQVYPITAFHDEDVNNGSQRLVEAHSRNWPTKRILMQVGNSEIFSLWEIVLVCF